MAPAAPALVSGPRKRSRVDLHRDLVIPVSLQIFSRFTELIPHYIWTEEMARFLFVWTIMLGAMIGVRESTHFEVDIWPNAQPPRRGA